jgi:hypothetical protein
MAGVVLSPLRGTLLESLEEARGVAGEFVVLDGPEYGLRQHGETARFVRELSSGLRLMGLRAIVNLNSAAPPPWADDLAEGPLFTGHRSQESHGRDDVADALREGLAEESVRVDWHLADRDFAPGAIPRLLRVLRAAADGAPVAFVFDRSRRAVQLAEGLDRRYPALLTNVGVRLDQLAARTPLSQPESYLQRLGSLARLALSAALQKRNFLRRHTASRPGLGRGFLLDRARLSVSPLGLEATARRFTGQGVWEGPAGLEFARAVLQRLQTSLRQDGQSCRLETTLAPGLTNDHPPSDPPAPLAAGKRLRKASWFADSDLGTVQLALTPGELAAPVGQVEALRQLWRQTDVARVRFTPPHGSRQLVAAWIER